MSPFVASTLALVFPAPLRRRHPFTKGPHCTPRPNTSSTALSAQSARAARFPALQAAPRTRTFDIRGHLKRAPAIRAFALFPRRFYRVSFYVKRRSKLHRQPHPLGLRDILKPSKTSFPIPGSHHGHRLRSRRSSPPPVLALRPSSRAQQSCTNAIAASCPHVAS